MKPKKILAWGISLLWLIPAGVLFSPILLIILVYMLFEWAFKEIEKT